MKKNIYIFLDRNMGHGFEKAYPDIPLWLIRFYLFLIGTPKTMLYKRFGFLIYHRSELDENCTDPRSIGRSPRIEISAIFPFGFNEKHLFSQKGNDLLKLCWDTAMQVDKKGANKKLKIDLPTEWYAHEETEHE